ncbi:hypothetical protein DFP73DRAFT_3511 [Morchella snyderi]|nr:hypothetical protein DFP73DRAFT_3511 [Morchella snyderi]
MHKRAKKRGGNGAVWLKIEMKHDARVFSFSFSFSFFLGGGYKIVFLYFFFLLMRMTLGMKSLWWWWWWWWSGAPAQGEWIMDRYLVGRSS